MADKTLVSVIVPTKNAGATIETCLKSIRNQTYKNIEIILVGSFSEDEAKMISEAYGANIINVNAKRSRARNIGARKAVGAFVLFVDSDMELDFSVIEECVKEIKECDGVIIPEISVGEGFWAKCKALEKACYLSDDTLEAARFFVKKVFEIVGGYSVELEAGEDWDLSQKIGRAGYSIERIHASIRHHEGKLGLRETMLKKRYYGRTLELYRMKHPEEARQQLRLIRPAFIRNWRRLAKDPAHAIGMLVMKTCEFAAGGVGVLSYRLQDSQRSD